MKKKLDSWYSQFSIIATASIVVVLSTYSVGLLLETSRQTYVENEKYKNHLIITEVAVASEKPEEKKVEKKELTVEEKIRKAFPEDPDRAVRIANCESSLDNNRVGDRNIKEPSIGLFQINRYYHPNYSLQQLATVDGNIKAAREIYEKSGWQPWTCNRLVK